MGLLRCTDIAPRAIGRVRATDPTRVTFKSDDADEQVVWDMLGALPPELVVGQTYRLWLRAEDVRGLDADG